MEERKTATRREKYSWSQTLKDYRSAPQLATGCRPAAYVPKQRIQNPITHEYYDKQSEAVIRETENRMRIQLLNGARDRQLAQQSAYNPLTHVNHYHSIAPPPPKPSVVNYEFQQPHIKPPGYKQPEIPYHNVEQRKSLGVTQSFSNFTDPTLPLFGGKNKDMPVTGGKRIVKVSNRWEMGYDDRFSGPVLNQERLPEKRHFEGSKKLQLGYWDQEQQAQ